MSSDVRKRSEHQPANVAADRYIMTRKPPWYLHLTRGSLYHLLDRIFTDGCKSRRVLYIVGFMRVLDIFGEKKNKQKTLCTFIEKLAVSLTVIGHDWSNNDEVESSMKTNQKDDM